MMRSLKRVGLLAAAGVVLGGGAALAGASAPATAAVCAHVTAYTPAADPGTGTCVPLLEEWIDPCYAVWHETAGFGGRVEACAPSPI